MILHKEFSVNEIGNVQVRTDNVLSL